MQFIVDKVSTSYMNSRTGVGIKGAEINVWLEHPLEGDYNVPTLRYLTYLTCDQRTSGILPKGVTVACRNSLGSSSSRILQERLLVAAKAQQEVLKWGFRLLRSDESLRPNLFTHTL